MKCPVCKDELREGVEEEDGPGGPIPGNHYLFCPGCTLHVTGTESVIRKFKENVGGLKSVKKKGVYVIYNPETKMVVRLFDFYGAELEMFKRLHGLAWLNRTHPKHQQMLKELDFSAVGGMPSP